VLFICVNDPDDPESLIGKYSNKANTEDREEESKTAAINDMNPYDRYK